MRRTMFPVAAIMFILLVFQACAEKSDFKSTALADESQTSSETQLSVTSSTDAAQSTVLIEPTFEVTDFYGQVTVSPAKAAPCTLIFGDGSVCKFETELSFSEYAQRFSEVYGCDYSSFNREHYFFFIFHGEPDYSGKPAVTAKFLLYKADDGGYILHNMQADLLLQSGEKIRIFFPFYMNEMLPDGCTEIEAGKHYPIERNFNSSLYTEIFYGMQKPMYKINSRGYTVYAGGKDILYVASIDYVCVDEYKPYEIVYTGNFAETIQNALRDMHGGEDNCFVYELNAKINGLSFKIGKSPGEFVLLFTYKNLGMSREEAISRLSELSLPALESFTSSDYPLENLEPISGFTSLRSVFVSSWSYTMYHYNPKSILSDISALGCLYNLTSFQADYCSISDLTPLIPLKNTLQFLSLRKNEVSDVSALSGFSALHVVDLESNKITDASPLTDLISPDGLYGLSLRSNPLKRISDFTVPKPDQNGDYNVDLFIDFTETIFSKRNCFCSSVYSGGG